MKESFLLAGTGGQGVQVLGQLMAHCANLQGLQVTFNANYSGNMRGAPSNCTVIVSESFIVNPIEPHPGNLIAFTQLALEKLTPRVVPGGTVYYDSSQIVLFPGLQTDLIYIGCPASTMAEAMGELRCANMILLGFLCEKLTLFKADVMRQAIKTNLARKPELLALDLQAFEQGRAYEAAPEQ